MYVHTITGRTTDATALRHQLDRWELDVASHNLHADFLGATAEVTDDGRFVAVARFAREEASYLLAGGKAFWQMALVHVEEVTVRGSDHADGWVPQPSDLAVTG